MALDIGVALREGFRRTIAPSGLVLVAAFLVIGAASTVLSQSLLQSVPELLQGTPAGTGPPGTPPVEGLAGPAPLAVPIPYPAALVGVLALALLAESARIVTIRVVASEHTDTVPRELVRRRLGAATLNGFVGDIVVRILIGIGILLLVVPGVFLGLSFFFLRQEIALEDSNFVDAMGDSWNLAGGNRWELLGLAIVVFVIQLVSGIPGIVAGFVDTLAGAVVNVAVGAPVTVFGIAVATRAYEQLRAERAERFGLEEELDDGFDDPV